MMSSGQIKEINKHRLGEGGAMEALTEGSPGVQVLIPRASVACFSRILDYDLSALSPS